VSESTKLDPATLSAEERALWDTLAIRKLATGTLPENAYARSEGALIDLLKVRRALFGTVTEKAQESAFPVGNCKVCGELVAPYNKHAKYEGGYTCQPAQPEPADSRQDRADQIKSFLGGDDDEPAQLEPAAQGEMPDEVDRACDLLEWSGNVNAAAALRDAWRTHSQPNCSRCGKPFVDGAYHHPKNVDVCGTCYAEMRPKVELPKVPVDALKRACATCSLDDCMTIAGWLDAAEGRK